MSLKGFRQYVDDKSSMNLGGLPPSQLLKTGQTTSYHAGDDGDLEKGLSRKYTVLDSGQYSGTSNITINGKTHALSNNCVRDNRTGLMWVRYVPNADIGPATDGKLFWDQWTLSNKADISFTNATSIINSAAGDFDTGALCVGRKFTISGSANNDGTYTVTAITANNITVSETLTDEAVGASVSIATAGDLIWDFLDQADTNSLGGHTDWRIPNLFELYSILNLGESNPSIDTTIFPSTLAVNHWTSSTYDWSNANAWVLHFLTGTPQNTNRKTSKLHCRLIRGWPN